jgi:predicted transcriptional regulator
MAMTLRLTDDETEALRQTAEREHRSMQDVARTAIREYTGKREQFLRGFLAEVVREDENLLKRLGDL